MQVESCVRNNTFTIAILLLLCFLSHAVSEEEDTVTINLDEKIVDEEENLTSKEATCENETTTIAEPLREIVSDEIGTDTFTIRSEVDDFHETVLQLESQSSSSKEFQFLKFQSRGETVLEVDGDGTLETSDVKIAPRSRRTRSSLSMKNGKFDVEKGDVFFSDSTVSVSKSDVVFSQSQVSISSGEISSH